MYFKEFREKIGLTQKQIAEIVQTTPSLIAKYEKGKTVPISNILLKYAEYLNANPNFIMLGIEPIFLNKQLEINEKYLLEEKMEQLKQLENEIEQLVKKVKNYEKRK